MNDKNKPVIQCIREFKLRQHYPSMIKKSKHVGKTVIINGSLESLIPINTKIKSKMNAQVKNGFHKFRLKLPSGKDLGECNMKILPNHDILKGRTVIIINQNKCKNFNKSVISLNAMSENKTKNLVGNIPLRSMNSTFQKNVTLLNTDQAKNDSIVARANNVKYQSQSIPLKYDISNDQSYEEIKSKGIENMDTDITTDKGSTKNGRFEHNNIQRRLGNNKQSTNENSPKNVLFSRPVKMVNNIRLSPLTQAPSYSVNTSGAMAKTVENHSNIINSVSQNGHRLDAEKKLYFLSMEDRNIHLPLEQKPNKIDLKSDNYSFTQQTVNTIFDKSIPEYKKISRENVMVIVHDNETSLLDNGMKTVHEMNVKPINNRNYNTYHDNIPVVTETRCYENLQSPDVFPNTFDLNENQCNIEQNIDKPLEENHVDENASLKKMFSSSSVLKDVMSIIRNEKLKAKALKASANCAIEIEQQIPLNIPKDTKTVPNTKVQRETYSLLESENVLNVKEDTFSTAEIIPKELYFTTIPENLNVNSLHYMPFYKNSTFSPFNQLQEYDTLLDKSIDGNVINDICNKHSTANKVKEVLSQPNVLCNKIFEQLQRDFETVRKWDENGMLNIHKAVISNRIYDIQRHLMVLKACNVNVDIPTQSGMTSLELAIKYNGSSEIVKLLLDAGANPASFQQIHDSALIVASKISSPLLPLLINHVSSSRLLDYVDFTGFAALHYCAQYGNLEGVNSLINMGANVNLQESRSGRTPLFLSIENNHLVIAEKLIENGAQADIPNFSGQTVMCLKEKIKDLSLVTLLHTMR